MTNQQIINQFTSFNKEDYNSKQKALNIRNGKLYSYNLLIGEYITEEGFSGLLVHDHWAKGLGFYSSTTSQHVSMLLRTTKHHPRRLKSEQTKTIFNTTK